jgi:hypothetical protein
MARVSKELLHNVFQRLLKAYRKKESTGYNVGGWFIHDDDNGITIGEREAGGHGGVNVLYPSCKPSELVERMRFSIALRESQ